MSATSPILVAHASLDGALLALCDVFDEQAPLLQPQMAANGGQMHSCSGETLLPPGTLPGTPRPTYPTSTAPPPTAMAASEEDRCATEGARSRNRHTETEREMSTLGIDDCEYTLVRASGRSAIDCWGLGLRKEFEVAFSPRECESWAIYFEQGKVDPTKTRVSPDCGAAGWWTDLFYALDGTTYVTDTFGQLRIHPPGAPTGHTAWTTFALDFEPTGVWGLDDGVLYVWGFESSGRPVFGRLVQGAFTRLADPAVPVDHLHGIAHDTIFAGGEGGYLARFDGAQWREVRVPTGNSITGLFVAGPDEFYAVTAFGLVMEGSATGWVERARVDYELGAVAKKYDRVWVGAYEEGLLALVDKTDELKVVDHDLHARRFDVRGNLLVTCKNQIADSTDGKTFTPRAVDRFELICQKNPRLW